MLFAQIADPRLNFWNDTNGSLTLWVKIVLGFVAGVLLVLILSRTPPQYRKYVIGTSTFIAGVVYILLWLWPAPINRQAATLPQGPVEGVGFALDDAIQRVSDFSNIIGGLFLGLGVFSLVRIHGRKLVKQQQDWGFSLVLLICMVIMVVVGYWDFPSRIAADADKLQIQANWSNINYARDLLFNGLLQTMDSAMFSLIAFYILSAAYRAFRIRSVEATILLAAALVMILSVMCGVTYMWNSGVNAMTQHIVQHGAAPGAPLIPDSGAFIQNFKLNSMSDWLQNTLQSSSLRGIDFGIGIGGLAMGMRIWLSLEKGGLSA